NAACCPPRAVEDWRSSRGGWGAADMEPEATAAVLAALGALLVVSAVASAAWNRVAAPVLLLFLVVGILAGSEGIGGIAFGDYAHAFRRRTVGLVVMRFDGGLNTSLAVVKRVAAPAALRATVGVLLTAAFLTGIGILIGMPVPLAVMIGAIVSSTDAAAVFAI